jgi:uncharacterized membrane protein YfcA
MCNVTTGIFEIPASRGKKLDVTAILILCAIFLFGGFVKGLLGIGLPALLVGLLTFFYEPRYAVSLILITIMATNLRQAMQGGRVLDVFRRYWVFTSIAVVFIFCVAIVGGAVPVPALLIVVGVGMTLFALTSLFVDMPLLPPRYDKVAQAVAGLGSGILGGLTAIWGPPLVVYLMSLHMERRTFVQALGVMFATQSVPLTLGFVVSGELTAETAVLSVGLLIPAFSGMYFGEKLRDRIDTKLFFRLFLTAFLLLGLNLIRRGLFGS